MWAEIERLAREERMTILLTTHYLEEADRLASQLAIVDRGRIVARGTPDELKAELEGDAIQVELADADGGRRAGALERVTGSRDVLARRPHAARARAPTAAPPIPAVLAALEAHGVRAAAVTLARPSLDDVYLRHAGARSTTRTWRHDRRCARPGRSPCATCACCCASPRSS